MNNPHTALATDKSLSYLLAVFTLREVLWTTCTPTSRCGCVGSEVSRAPVACTGLRVHRAGHSAGRGPKALAPLPPRGSVGR